MKVSGGLLRVLVIAAAFALPQGAAAQGLELAPVAVLPSPRLVFSRQEMLLAEAVAQSPGLADFYGSNGLKPIFMGEQGAARRAAVINAVAQAESHGLPAQRYHMARLMVLDAEGGTSTDAELAFAKALADWSHDLDGGLLNPQRIDPAFKREVLRRSTGEVMREFGASTSPQAVLEGLAPQDPRYQMLRKALGPADQLAVPAGTPLVPEGLLREGAEGAAVLALRTRLAAAGFSASGAGRPEVFDMPLTQAVRAFQDATGLIADGVAGPQTIRMLNHGRGAADPAILVALERMRWMNGHDLNARHVWVNLPEYSARIMENGQEVFQTRVVIGKAQADFETPEFSDEMEYLVVNPRWNVPRSITVREYLPRLKANRNAVSHLDVVDAAGNVIARERINFGQYTAANFPYRMRQKPSDDNALGVVKFMFPNPWNIYLHDTPTKHLFDQSRRAYSHGCIRIGRPRDLAHELMRDSFDDPQARFARALESGRETYLNLRPAIPVHLVYFTAFPDESGKIRHYADIYDRDAKVYAALTKLGVASAATDE